MNCDALEGKKAAAHRARAGALDATIGSNDAMGGNEEREWGLGHCLRYRAMRTRTTDCPCDLSIRDQHSDLQKCNGLPNRNLQLGAFESHRQVETPQAACEVGARLPADLAKQRIAARRPAQRSIRGQPATLEQLALIARDVESCAQRRFENGCAYVPIFVTST